MFPIPKEAITAKNAKSHARTEPNVLFFKPFFIVYIGPPLISPLAFTSRYLIASIHSLNLDVRPNAAEIHIHTRAPDEVNYWYCYSQQLGYHRAEELKKRYEELEPDESYTEAPQVYSGKICLDTEDKLLRYLAYVKVGADDPMSEKSQAYQEFVRLLTHAKEIIAKMYQGDEVEKSRNKVWNISDITDSDVEKVICSGIPVNKMGNLKKMSASILAKHFSQKRFSRQRINSILNHKFPVERFDLITLEFFIISQEMQDDDPYNRYHHFLEEIQEILKKCGMSEIYIVNPYECFLLMCLLTDCPLAVFADIWEMSYEEDKQEE